MLVDAFDGAHQLLGLRVSAHLPRLVDLVDVVGVEGHDLSRRAAIHQVEHAGGFAKRGSLVLVLYIECCEISGGFCGCVCVCVCVCMCVVVVCVCVCMCVVVVCVCVWLLCGCCVCVSDDHREGGDASAGVVAVGRRDDRLSVV